MNHIDNIVQNRVDDTIVQCVKLNVDFLDRAVDGV